MSEENIFKRLALIKGFKPATRSTGCQICNSGLVHVRHTENKGAYVFKCNCVLGKGRTEAYPNWNNSLEFEPLYIEE